jgi:hypothetical protein
VNVRAFKIVPFRAIEDHFRLGWVILIPNAPMHHHHYSCELAWICDCPVPGESRATARGKHERADDRAQ